MATVRELTTRFKFDTDKKGLSEFREGISGAKTAIIGLVGALGVGALAKAILAAGDNLRRSAILAQQFTDEVEILDGRVGLVGEMADAWQRVQDAIPGRETMGEFLQSFNKFRQNFRDAPLEQFETLFEAAGNLARITGRPLTEMFEALHNAILSGDVQALVDMLPQLDQADAAMANFVRNLVEGLDPTNVQTVGERLDRITDLLADVNPQLRETAELMVETTQKGQWDNLLDNMSRMGEIIGNEVKPVLVDLLGTANDFMDVWIDGGVTIASFRDAFRKIFDIELNSFIVRSLRGMSRFLSSPTTFFSDLASGALSFADQGLAAGGAFLQETFGINAPRSVQEAVESVKGFSPGDRGPRLGFASGSGVFAPQITVNGGMDERSLARMIFDTVSELYDEALDQFGPQEENPQEQAP